MNADAPGGMTVGFGTDDAGYELKSMLLAEISALPGMKVIEFGVSSAAAAEPYPKVGVRVAGAVARGEVDRAILVCGTGIGMALSANKVPACAQQSPTTPTQWNAWSCRITARSSRSAHA